MPYSAKQVSDLQTERDKTQYDGMDDDTFLAAVNTKNLDDIADPLAILNYTMTNEFRNSAIYGRVALVGSLLPDPVTGDYGNVQLGAANALVEITRRHVAAARSFIRLTQSDSGLAVPLTQLEVTVMFDDLVTTGGGCEAMSAANRDAIVALSENQKSPAQAAGLPPPTLADVARTT